jgi:hypothetical protein
MQAQLDELQVALEDRITPLEARQDEFATVLDLLVSRAEGFERKLQAGSDSLAEHIAGSQEALSGLEGALFDKLDASRQEFFLSQDALAEERSSEIELINGALATIEERLQADVKAREEEVGLVNAALQSLESQLEETVGSGLSKLKTDFEEQLSLLADAHATHAAEHRAALQDLAGKHHESTQQHRQELETQIAELHAKHETLHASHSESAEQHRQELVRQVAELHAKHDALHASHSEIATQHQESVEEKLTALSERHTIAAEQQTAVLEEQLRALAAKHKETLEEQRNMQVQQRRRRCDVAHQRANCRMELVYAGRAFTPWLAAARALQEEKGRVYHQELRVQDEELRTQLEALSVAHSQSTKDHRSEVDIRIQALSDKYEQTINEHKAELRLQLDALSKDHSEMSGQFRESLEAQLKVLAAEHEKAVTEHKQSLEAHRAEAAEKTGLIDDAMSELEAQMARGNEQKDQEIAVLQAQIVNRIEALQNSQHQSSVDQEAQLQAIAASHSESAEQHRQELETQIAELHAKHETLRASHSESAEQHRQELETQIAELHAKHETLRASHSESAEQHRQELERQVAELHAKHDALHASHSGSAEQHRQELERQVAELHAKHDALHEKHTLTAEEQRSAVEEQLVALAKEHASQLKEHESTAQKQLEYHLTEHSEQTAQQKRALELKLVELSNQHEQALAMQRAELAEKRQRRIETSGQRAVHRMENSVVCRAFGPWLAAARDQVRASTQEKLKSVAESADVAVIGMTRAANELEAVQFTLQASEIAKSDLASEIVLHRQTLEEQIEALTAKHGKELSGLRMDALERSKSISDASRAVQEVLMEMQTVREDCAAIERRLTEEFVSVQVTCDRLARVAATDTLKKALDEEVENRRQDVDMCNEAILALAEQLATGPPEVRGTSLWFCLNSIMAVALRQQHRFLDAMSIPDTDHTFISNAWILLLAYLHGSRSYVRHKRALQMVVMLGAISECGELVVCQAPSCDNACMLVTLNARFYQTQYRRISRCWSPGCDKSLSRCKCDATG